jgi:hypothetical protein
MKNSSLDKLLQTLAVPVPDDSARDRALHRAQTAFANRPVGGHPNRTPWLGLAFATTGLIVISVLALSLTFRSTPATVPTLAAQNNVFQQMEDLFPGQLEAVIEHGDSVDLKLAPKPGPATDQRLIVTFHRTGSIIRVLSYSGRKVCLDLSGRRVCFEMLLTEAGGVILLGDDFLWSGGSRASVAGYHVEAMPLRHSS